MSSDCISCGMPMETMEDHALSELDSNYCIHCAKPDGSMRSYEEVLEGLTQFLVREEGLNETEAKANAREMMTKLPAWEEKS